jgi:hypothetical protein
MTDTVPQKLNSNSESNPPVRRRNAWVVGLTLGVVVLAVAGFAATRSRGPAVCPVEVRKVMTTNGTATFQLTNHSAFDVLVDFGANYEIKTREGWQRAPLSAGASYQGNMSQLNGHDATLFTGVPLPILRPGTVWRLRVQVHSSEGALNYWIRNPRDFWITLRFRDALGRFKVGMHGSVFPTTTEATTAEECFE